MTRIMACALAGVLAGGGGAAIAQELGLLAQVRVGEWQIHEIGAKAPARPLCVSDPRQLLQLEHGGAACAFRTLSTDGSGAVVRYVCPGAGNGLTEMSLESRDIVRVHTQGVQRGEPFDTTYEARFAGPCRAGLANR